MIHLLIELYTDGACSGNPGPGGYAYYLKAKGNSLQCSGAKEKTTNNRMELLSVVKGINQALQIWPYDGKREIKVYSDSAYVVNTVQQCWYKTWKQCNWKTKQGKEVKNKDLWERLVNLLESIERRKDKASIEFIKIKGHSGNKYNEMVDELAKQAIKNLNAQKGTK